ncbi:LOW QUALITY PROTEIN: ran-binding protein 3-like [Brienomyrus brachyistius]|uniref:LOW QUALITY PROTEIN: ran-binding protein 3-like n=1 Tax=Brienomyrus brachyistius TaxID=42636 RepID=UPI0020B4002E|nr:LOW QUALITY PROTEIN: ran-binding protein 3-like [Brienomyrus brachyistius]
MDADRHVAVSREKPVIAPAVFVFQKTPPTQKRWAEDGEEGADLGASACKRRRSLTFPSVRPRCRKGYERRTRTNSISFPTPASGSPPGQQRMLLRPTTLPAPQPWSSPYQPLPGKAPSDPDTSLIYKSTNSSGLNAEMQGLWRNNGRVEAKVRPIRFQNWFESVLAVVSSLAAARTFLTCMSLSSFHVYAAERLATPTLAQSHLQNKPVRCSLFPQMGLGPSGQAVVEMGWDSSARTVPLMPCDPRILRDKIPFVFGENMSERVLSPSKCSEDSSVSSSDCSDSELSDEEPSYPMSEGRTLQESAAAYTAAHRGWCLLKRIQVVTGEEQESNVVQLTCKLFVLERGTQSWSERGRGILRLNDMVTASQGRLQSRLVMRHQGTLKLILNSRLWPQTRVRRASRCSLQVTATDLESHAVRVFLVQAGARDAARLYVAIHHRLIALRSQHREAEDEDGEDATKPGQAEKREEDGAECGPPSPPHIN